MEPPRRRLQVEAAAHRGQLLAPPSSLPGRMDDPWDPSLRPACALPRWHLTPRQPLPQGRHWGTSGWGDQCRRRAGSPSNHEA